MIANVAFGGSIAGAYAAFKFLHAKTADERAHYDWMGYMGNFIAISAFLPLPFAGYWLGKEIYGYSQNLGMTMMAVPTIFSMMPKKIWTFGENFPQP